MRYVYGPVKSRRLGRSLGISLIPYKVCNFDCVYCQLNKTLVRTNERKEYVLLSDIWEELRTVLSDPGKIGAIDCITFAGSGEPLLSSCLGVLIPRIRELTSLKIVLITNGSLLADASARRDVSGVDLIVPSLDAVTQDIFEKINRPVEGIGIEAIIEGLKMFRRESKARMWIEIMLVAGLNDSLDYLRKMGQVVADIGPDKIQLNSPVRTPSESWARPVSSETMAEAQKIFGSACEIL